MMTMNFYCERCYVFLILAICASVPTSIFKSNTVLGLVRMIKNDKNANVGIGVFFILI